MISAFTNTWRVPELRHRILLTLAMIIIIRLGVHITLPGVNGQVIADFLEHLKKSDDGTNPMGGLGAMLQVFTGGGLQQAGIFALGITPYISASIMVQLLTAVVPKLARLAREDNGRQKISDLTRWITIGIAGIQGFFVARSLTNPESMPYFHGISKFGDLVAPNPSMGWYALIMLTIVAGTLLIMWIGDQMTERGIGNGTSIIICVNIIAGLPAALIQAYRFFLSDGNVGNVMMMVVLVALVVVVIAGVITITQGQRRIAVQYAKRVVGRKQFGGQTQYLPLKVNYAGVMPVIFASAVLSLPPMLLRQAFPTSDWAINLYNTLSDQTSAVHSILGAMGIFAFSYFWVVMMFQPSQIAEDLKRNGGYVPGVRPGKPTADFLSSTMNRLTFAGAIFLTLIYLTPVFMSGIVGLQPGAPVLQIFGGTSLLILVGVVLDVMRQVETHLIQRNYDGFLRKGKIKGRYDRLNPTGKAASSSLLLYLWVVAAVIMVAGVVIWALK